VRGTTRLQGSLLLTLRMGVFHFELLLIALHGLEYRAMVA
jgi:hypothetical protein